MKVLKIGAVWCPECRIMKPRWAKIEQDNPWLKTQYYDYDEHPEIVSKYEIKEMPSFIFLDKNGQEILRLHGEIAEDELLAVINKHKDK